LQMSNASFPEKFQTDVSTAVDALLRRDWRERPKAIDICTKFKSYCQQLASDEFQEEKGARDPYKPQANDSEAVADWKALLMKNPSNLGLHKRLADAYRNEGNFDLEINVLTTAAKKDPTSRYYQDQLTDAYERRENINLTTSGWKDVLEHPDGWVLIEPITKTMENEIEYWKERLFKKPGELILQQSLVKAFRRQGDIDGEIETFNDLIRRFPGAWYLADRLSDAYKFKGNMDEAIVSWKELVNMQPGNTWWQARLAEAYEIKGDVPGERKMWREFVRVHPDVESLQERLATTYEKK